MTNHEETKREQFCIFIGIDLNVIICSVLICIYRDKVYHKDLSTNLVIDVGIRIR